MNNTKHHGSQEEKYLEWLVNEPVEWTVEEIIIWDDGAGWIYEEKMAK